MPEIVRVNGVNCILYQGRYDKFEDRGKKISGNYHYAYYLHHAEFNWDKPVTIERFVLVNRFGMVLAQKELLGDSESCRKVRSFEYLEG